LVRLSVLVVLTVLVFRFGLVLVRVEGISMSPTYQDHHVGIINRLSYLFHDPRRGDVVAVRPMAGEHAGYYLKRIVGLPGESVAFHAGQLLINGRPLDEPYLRSSYSWEMESVTVGPNSYYVVGDNRTMDWADHFQGRTGRDRIVGRILL
jgi:signal peptidase I